MGLSDDELKQIIEWEEVRIEKTRQRHARETMAVVGKALGVSRESIRKAKITQATFSDAKDLAMTDEYSVDKLYRLAIGDTTVGLYVRIPPELKQAVKDEAAQRGLTLAAFVAMALVTQIYGEET
jgi:predicted DNA binding CopG/RHH family protein